MVLQRIPDRQAGAAFRAIRPPFYRRTAGRFTGAGILIIALVTLTTACAGGQPSVDDPRISRKIDLRLRTALSQAGWSEELGEYVRVIVRMNRDDNPEDRQAISELGAIGSWSGQILTLTIAPDRVVSLASHRHVEYVELSMRNVPMPVPPPVEERP